MKQFQTGPTGTTCTGSPQTPATALTIMTIKNVKVTVNTFTLLQKIDILKCGFLEFILIKVLMKEFKWSVFKWCVVSHVSQMAFLYIKRPFLPRLVYTITQMYSWKWKFQLVKLKAILHITWEP